MKLTSKQLAVWNARHYKLAGGISANENWNVSVGLPGPEVRQHLKQLHSQLYGICSPAAPITMAQFKKSLEQ